MHRSLKSLQGFSTLASSQDCPTKKWAAAWTVLVILTDFQMSAVSRSWRQARHQVFSAENWMVVTAIVSFRVIQKVNNVVNLSPIKSVPSWTAYELMEHTFACTSSASSSTPRLQQAALILHSGGGPYWHTARFSGRDGGLSTSLFILVQGPVFLL